MIRHVRFAILLILAAVAVWFALQLEPEEKVRGTLVLCGGALEFTGEQGGAAAALRDVAKNLMKGGRAPALAAVHSGAPSLHDAESAWHGEPNDPGYEEIFTGLGLESGPSTWEGLRFPPEARRRSTRPTSGSATSPTATSWRSIRPYTSSPRRELQSRAVTARPRIFRATFSRRTRPSMRSRSLRATVPRASSPMPVL